MRNPEMDEREKYQTQLFAAEGPLKQKSREAAALLGLARISLSPSEGSLISLLLRLHQAKRVVEIGTLTGLSAQYIFDSLPAGGCLWTLEKSPEHVREAEKILSQLPQAGKKIQVVAGDAREKLPTLEKDGPFDAVFIDGNKAAYGDYLEWAEKNLRSGGLIIADNVFLSGAVWGAETTQRFNEKQIQVLCRFNQRLADTSLYHSALIPTQEGLFVAIKNFA